MLLSFVDPNLPGLPREPDFTRDDVLSARIAELARQDQETKQRLIQLCETEFPPPIRHVLAMAIGRIGDLQASIAGLNLIDDSTRPPIPRANWEQVEAAFVERRPFRESENVSTLEPQIACANRTRLVEMASTDPRRKKAAVTLLAQIEEWRLEYARPAGEPRHPAFDSGMPWPPLFED